MDKYCIHCMHKINDEQVCSYCGKSLDYQTPPHHLNPGTILNQRYYVGKAIGEGGFGITYIGKDLVLDMTIAIKEYYPSGYVNRSHNVSSMIEANTSPQNQEFFQLGKEKFLNEARILAKFSKEPGVVEVRDFFEENNTVYIIMEYIEGETLSQYIQRKGQLSEEETLHLMTPIMNILDKIHKQELIHRDISPDNIMIENGQPKLLDFGNAKITNAYEKKAYL